MAAVKPFLDSFNALAANHPGPCPWSVSLDFGGHRRHAVFGSLIHGNETGSVPAVVQIIEDLLAGRVSYKGKVTFFLGNIPAALRELRAVEGDLNRVFTPEAPDSAEKRRAAELMPLIASADVFVDFHQTIQPSLEPFYIFKFHRPSYLWARLMGLAKVMVTRSPFACFEKGSMCSDEFAHSRGVPGVTLELGQKGLTEFAKTTAHAAMQRMLTALDEIATPHQLETMASGQPDFKFFTVVHKEPFLHPKSRLVEGFQNFSWVSQGQLLGHQILSTGEAGPEVFASDSGVLLFPKYPERDASGAAVPPVPGDLFHLAAPLTTHPESLWGQS